MFFLSQGKLSEDIKNQMKDNVAIKRFQPITSTERSINKDLLDRVSLTFSLQQLCIERGFINDIIEYLSFYAKSQSTHS